MVLGFDFGEVGFVSLQGFVDLAQVKRKFGQVRVDAPMGEDLIGVGEIVVDSPRDIVFGLLAESHLGGFGKIERDCE